MPKQQMPRKKFPKKQVRKITKASKSLYEMTAFLKEKPTHISKSVRFILPDGCETRIHIWKDNGKITSAVDVLNKDTSTHFGSNSIGMTWGRGKRNSEVRFERTRIPHHVSGIYFGAGKLSYVKRLKRKSKAEKT